MSIQADRPSFEGRMMRAHGGPTDPDGNAMFQVAGECRPPMGIDAIRSIMSAALARHGIAVPN